MNTAQNLAATAERLLATYGEVVTYVRVTAGTYAPATGSATPTLDQSDVFAVHADNRVRQQDGSVIRYDAVLYIKGLPTMPLPGDRIVIRGQGYRVTPVETYTLQGMDVLHVVGCTRG